MKTEIRTLWIINSDHYGYIDCFLVRNSDLGHVRVAHNEGILENVTSLGGLGFILGQIVQYKKKFLNLLAQKDNQST